MESKEYIVAEITKNWINSKSEEALISHRFELVIDVNLSRGYELKEWKFSTDVFGGVLTETIIAVFKKINLNSLG